MRFAFVLLFATALAGCSGNELPPEASIVLRSATTLELFSLDPLNPNNSGSTSELEAFHNWTVLGSTTITDAATVDGLVSALEAGVTENSDEMAAACFWPRHGIRVTYEGKQYDFVICFQCYQGEWYIDGQQKEGFLLSRSPRPAFDRALHDASVPLADPPPG